MVIPLSTRLRAPSLPVVHRSFLVDAREYPSLLVSAVEIVHPRPLCCRSHFLLPCLSDLFFLLLSASSLLAYSVSGGRSHEKAQEELEVLLGPGPPVTRDDGPPSHTTFKESELKYIGGVVDNLLVRELHRPVRSHKAICQSHRGCFLAPLWPAVPPCKTYACTSACTCACAGGRTRNHTPCAHQCLHLWLQLWRRL